MRFVWKALVALMIGFGTSTLVAWLGGADIFQPQRGSGLVFWFMSGAWDSLTALGLLSLFSTFRKS